MAKEGEILVESAARPPRFGSCALAAVALALAFVLAGFGAGSAYAAETGLKAGGSVQVSATATAANSKGRANVATLFRYGLVNLVSYRNGTAKSSAYDITGDKRPDTIAIGVSPRTGTGLFDAITVKVNGSATYSMKAPASGFDQAVVQILTLRNNVPLLYVSVYGVDGNARQVLLRYASGRFAKVVGNDLLVREGTSNAYITSIRPSANRVIVQFDFTSTVSGLTRTSFTYVWKGSGLVRKSNASSALRFATKATGGYTRQARNAARSFVAFTDPTLKKKAFTVPAGKSVRLLGLALSGSGLVYKLRYGNKTGWVKCPGSAEGKGATLLSGVYGRVPLISNAPAYSTKVVGLATLQRYSNHALYIARNEVYARHGLIYSTDELKAYYSSMGWYVPKAHSVSLSKAEMKNVALIRSIEKHRKSPYV